MSREEEEQQRRGFKVEDRRRFSESGEPRTEAVEPTPPPQSPPSEATSSAATAAPDAGHFEMHAQHPGEELSFSSFVMGLITQALVYLGEVADPVSKQAAPDLAAARQMIDILGILQQKTRGNLDKSESELLDGMLYDLRLRFVERSRR